MYIGKMLAKMPQRMSGFGTWAIVEFPWLVLRWKFQSIVIDQESGWVSNSNEDHQTRLQSSLVIMDFGYKGLWLQRTLVTINFGYNQLWLQSTLVTIKLLYIELGLKSSGQSKLW